MKDLYESIRRKRRKRQNMGLLLNGAGDLCPGIYAWWGQGIDKLAPGVVQCCPVTGQETVTTNWNAGNLI